MNERIGKIPTIITAALLASSCAAPPPAPVSDLSRPRATAEVYRIVRPGDTLYSLSWAAGVDYRQLAAWNGLAPPYVIRPGQRISLVPTGQAGARVPAATPPAAPKVSALPRGDDTGARAVAPAPVPTTPGAPATSTTAAAAPSPSPATAPAPDATQARSAPKPLDPSSGQGTPERWIWPVQGRVVADFAKARGVDIAVSSGTPVKASAGGQVVYAGSGLRGYGQLIIVKHSNEYLSAYGHNRKLLVQEGDSIVSGQVIAESGSAPGKGEQVHFEIRRNGQPVDPAGLLPARS